MILETSEYLVSVRYVERHCIREGGYIAASFGMSCGSRKSKIDKRSSSARAVNPVKEIMTAYKKGA